MLWHQIQLVMERNSNSAETVQDATVQTRTLKFDFALFADRQKLIVRAFSLRDSHRSCGEIIFS